MLCEDGAEVMPRHCHNCPFKGFGRTKSDREELRQWFGGEYLAKDPRFPCHNESLGGGLHDDDRGCRGWYLAARRHGFFHREATHA